MYAIRNFLGAAVTIGALAGCQPATVVDPDGVARTNLQRPPPRQPGLWETRLTIGDTVTTTMVCLDEKVDRKVDWMGAQGTRGNCSENAVTRQDDNSLRFASVCDMGARGQVVTRGVARGDISLRYEAEGTQVTTGAQLPIANGERAVKVDAAWKGACPKEWHPGDMSIPSGVRYDAAAIGAAAPAAGR
ncbi:MAG: hypothetical protein C0481_00715 [Phenylobacterium sp.]|uniref:DUF3617 domain-containing protein n=1 Tax=Phenylobacterium sp. TaxID=1871053 RepID=UPI0025EAC793|nr:DUF3617 family protein [Phenylobacterium sp.]MBA4010361.1 hypothetical protein [Phenylobacterium sp.]